MDSLGIQEVLNATLMIAWKNSNDRIVASGSAFLARGYLITNNHVFRGPAGAKVSLVSNGRELLHEDSQTFARRLVTGSTEDNFDFAVLKFCETNLASVKPLDFADPSSVNIGDEIMLAGYPLAKTNVCLHRGHISSKYTRGMVDYIQIDASVNNGNSGGPLVDVSTGKVVGIVTRKETGLTSAVTAMRHASSKIIELYENFANSGGFVASGGINQGGVQIATQKLFLGALDEIERSANVGIGHAFSIKHVAGEPVFD